MDKDSTPADEKAEAVDASPMVSAALPLAGATRSCHASPRTTAALNTAACGAASVHLWAVVWLNAPAYVQDVDKQQEGGKEEEESEKGAKRTEKEPKAAACGGPRSRRSSGPPKACVL